MTERREGANLGPKHGCEISDVAGTGHAVKDRMSNSKLLTAIMVPALAFGGFKVWNNPNTSLFNISVPTSIELAVVTLAAAAAHTGTLMLAGVPLPSEVATTAQADEKSAPLPPIAEGPQTEPATETEPVPAAAAAKSEIKFETTDLLSGHEQGVVQPTFLGNGRERFTATLRNNSPNPLRVTIPAGQVFESGRNMVLNVRPVDAELMPAQTKEVRLLTVALYSANKVADASYKVSYQTAPKLETFLSWIAVHPEVNAAAIQTAALALTENLPLNSLSKFAPTNGIQSKLPTDAFRVETGDLIAALTALRDSGLKLDTIALSLDPQLRIESMIEPLSREASKRYYGITEEREWDFWKHELLNGDPGTRHYALFGIARFYPQIAVEMLPKWARETQTHPVYRMAAVQALAETQRPEAMPILHALSNELGATTELGKAAAQAAQYLDTRLAQNATASATVMFRGKKSVSGF